jgi:hypothetical protein
MRRSLNWYTGGVGKVGLAHSQEHSAGANLLPDMSVYGSRASGAIVRRLRHVRNLPIETKRKSCIRRLSRQNGS